MIILTVHFCSTGNAILKGNIIEGNNENSYNTDITHSTSYPTAIFICSNSTKETPEQSVKFNSKLKTPEWCQ